MKVHDLPLAGLKLIELSVFGDERGFFVERFNARLFEELGLETKFVQDNHSRSAPGVVRGLHYQVDPAQGKLVGCSRGKILDVAVDVRRGSPTYGQHVAHELSDLNGNMLWVPAGFAHGFCVLGNTPADVLYKVDQFYNPKTEGSIRWDDADLAIAWPIETPTVSARDQLAPSFASYQKNPAF